MNKDITEDPVNFPLRCAQIMAERADLNRMNIIERTALWYRLERIGEKQDIEPQKKPPQDVEVQHIHHNVNDTRRVFAKLNALDGAVKYLLQKEEQKGGKKFQGSYF